MTDFLLRYGWPLLASVAVKSLFVPALAGTLVWRVALFGLLLLPLYFWMPAAWQVPLAPGSGGVGKALVSSPLAPPELSAQGRSSVTPDNEPRPRNISH